jgi:proline iminopeptidase
MSDAPPTGSPALDRFLAFRRTLPPRPPLEALTVRARGLDFAVYRTPPVGSAPPLVCLNGGLLFDHTLLWPTLAPLAATRQLLLYDQRGRGASAVPPGHHRHRIEYDAGDLPALREALGIAQWDVLGHSWGGGIALLGTAQDVAGVRRLVLVDAVGVDSRWMAPLHAAALAVLTGEARARLAALDPGALTHPDLPVHAEYGQAFFPAWFVDQALPARILPSRGSSETGCAAVARLRREGYDWHEQVAGMPVPTLLVHGAADLLPMAEAHRTAGLLREARVVPIPDAGHNPFWEQPALFFGAIEAFLGAP